MMYAAAFAERALIDALDEWRLGQRSNAIRVALPAPDSGREWVNAEDVQPGDVILRDGEWHVVTRVTVDPIEHPTGSWRAVAIEFEGWRGAEVLSTSQRVLAAVERLIADMDGGAAE